jgi:glycosyltransferase involved in cell wall biosynthesis
MTADAVGGVGTYAVDLSLALARRGTQVLLAMLGPPPTNGQRAELAGCRGVDLVEVGGKLEWMDNPWGDVASAGRRLLALEREWGADVVHLNGYCHGTLPWSAPVLMVGHSCVRSWWCAVKGSPPPESLARYSASVAAGLAAADLVVAPSRAMLDCLDEHYGPLPESRVIPNGRAWPSRTTVDKQPLILTAGRLWDDAKNVQAVFELGGRLPWPVYVAGEIGHDAACTAVQRLGRLSADALRQWMQRASIYVLPARYEPFGLSVLEAAQAGCALVLGDLASLREIWADAAVYVPPDDRAALEAALRALIVDEDRRCYMAERAMRRARRYGLEQMTAAYDAAYRALCPTRTQSRAPFTRPAMSPLSS